MHEYRSPALKRLNCLLSEMDAAYHEAAQRQGQNDSTSRILYALCELGSPASLRAVCESTGLSKQTVNSALRKLEAEGILYLEPSGARSKRVCLTEAGLRVADATAGRLICSQKTFFFRLFSFFQFNFCHISPFIHLFRRNYFCGFSSNTNVPHLRLVYHNLTSKSKIFS